MLVAVAEVVLAELAARVAKRLQQFGDGRLILSDALRRTGYGDGQQPGAERRLSKDKGGATCGAGILGVDVGEKRALIRDAVDVWCLVTHHATAVGTDVPKTDVVAPDDDDVRPLRLRLSLCRGHKSEQRRYSDARCQNVESQWIPFF